MDGEQKICMYCMNPVQAGTAACPECGYNGNRQNPAIGLPVGYRLEGRYVVGGMHANDGDSVSYAGYDISLGKKVELREFLPVGGCARNAETGALIPKSGAELHYKTALMDFSDLFKNLKKLVYEEGLVRTLDFFETNQTAYAVLEDFEAVTLREFLALNNGFLKWEQCRTIMNPVFDAVNAVNNAHLIHRGISPETILVSRSGEIKLSGFATTSVRTKDTDVAAKLFSGYSAPEQYSSTMWQSAATDVYGAAAVIYRCVTGTTPQEADQRRMYDNLRPPSELSDVPPAVSRAIMLGMLVDQNQRPESILGFRQMLSGAPAGEKPRNRPAPKRPDAPPPAARPEEEKTAGQKQERLERGLKMLSIIAAAFFLVMLAVYLIFNSLDFTPGEDAEESPTAGTVSSPAVKIPDFRGRTLAEAGSLFDVVRLRYVIEKQYVEGAPEGTIIGQDPAAESSADIGDLVTLYINETYTVKMPGFFNLTRANAVLLLAELGISEENCTFETANTTEGIDGTVYRQSIAEGDLFSPEKDRLILTIAEHPDPEGS